MNRITAGILLILFLLVSACSQGVVVTGEADGAPAGCGVKDVAQRLVDFAHALNRSDPGLVPAFFDPANPTMQFRWYYAYEEKKIGAETTVLSVKELPAYFKRRQAQHEQLEFRRIQANGYVGSGLVNFEFTVTRRADDLNGGVPKEVSGKGALQCGTQTFVVLNIGDS